MTRVTPLLLLALRATASGCSNDFDCSLAGECDTASGLCRCDRGFTGAACAALDLAKESTRTFVGLPAAHVGNTTVNCVWGGHAVRSSPSGSEWAWFGAVIGDSKPLADWATNSLAGRGTSTPGKGPSGPYTLDSIVIEPERGLNRWDNQSIHGVYPLANPNPSSSGSDAYLLFFTGFAATADPLKTRQIGVAYAPTLNASTWTRHHTPVFGPNTINASALDSSSVSNAAPAFAPDKKSLLMAYKGLSKAAPGKPPCTDGSGKACISFASADNWFGPWTRLTSNDGVVLRGEDPSLFHNGRGWHMIYEYYQDPDAHGVRAVGAHAFSENGSDWTVTNTSSWVTTAAILDGENVILRHRERFQVVTDDTGAPVALFNGACDQPNDEYCFNIVTLIS